MFNYSNLVTKKISDSLSVHIVKDPQWSDILPLYTLEETPDLWGEITTNLTFPSLEHAKDRLLGCYPSGIYQLFYKDLERNIYTGMARSSDDRGVTHRISDRRSTMNSMLGWTNTTALASPYEDAIRMLDLIQEDSEIITADYVQNNEVREGGYRFPKNILDISYRVMPLIYSEGTGGDDYSAAYSKHHEVEAQQAHIEKYGSLPIINLKEETMSWYERLCYQKLMNIAETPYNYTKEMLKIPKYRDEINLYFIGA